MKGLRSWSEPGTAAVYCVVLKRKGVEQPTLTAEGRETVDRTRGKRKFKEKRDPSGVKALAVARPGPLFSPYRQLKRQCEMQKIARAT